PLEAVPRQPPRPRAARQPPTPQTGHPVEDRGQRVGVARDPIVPVVTNQLATQFSVLLPKRPMTVPLAPVGDRPDHPAQATRRRLLLDHVVPRPRLPP